jgi:UDP-N-acetylglucosamine 1-carboxyvinyltransferase
MQKLVVEGGRPLFGTVPISGAKNAALPVLAATLLAPGEHQLENVPGLADVSMMLSLLGRLGCPSLWNGRLRLETSRIFFSEAPHDLVRKMRASVLVLGPLLARTGHAHVSLPGGCAIGVRPIDQHLKGLEALGCRFELEDGYVHGRVDKLRGAEIHLDVPTVGGTENILMAAVLAEGHTVIHNAAAEPEIVDLARFLRSLGARIQGEGSATLEIQGVSSLQPAARPYRIMPDRIEAGTYLVAGAITGGEVTCVGTDPEHLDTTIDALQRAGCTVRVRGDAVTVSRSGPLRPVDIVTAPHPGFPTDMQAQLTALLTLAEGRSTVTETIFENRFMHVAELLRMGADIRIQSNTAVVRGVCGLKGASVMATDLRASAGLVLAALAAEGSSEVLRLHHLDRGYEALVAKLQGIGAHICRVDTEAEGTRRTGTGVHLAAASA